MGRKVLFRIMLYLGSWLIVHQTIGGTWNWMQNDAFEDYMKEFNSITSDNCRFRKGQFMQGDTLTRVPSFSGFLYVCLIHTSTQTFSALIGISNKILKFKKRNLILIIVSFHNYFGQLLSKDILSW